MKFKLLSKHTNLHYGMSERADGNLNLKSSGDPGYDLRLKENRQKFFKKENIDGNVCLPFLMHGNDVIVVNEENYRERFKADGFITREKNMYLTLTGADCFLLYFYDPKKEVVGLAHSGWKGASMNIAQEMVFGFVNNFKSNPADIVMAISPGIQKCHFIVKQGVVQEFKKYKEFIETIKDQEYYIDLLSIIKKQASKAGIKQVEASEECTQCNAEKYFSYRRDKPEFPDVMLAYIGIK